MMRVGVNAGFDHLIDPREWAAMEGMGLQTVRRGCTPRMGEGCEDVLLEFAGRPVRPLVLLGAEHLADVRAVVSWAQEVRRMAYDAGVEWDCEPFNEPDVFGSWRPDTCGDCIRAVHAALRDAGFTGAVLGGSVSNPEGRGRTYLSAMNWRTMPADVVATWHRYPHQLSATKGVDGMTRAEEVARMRMIVGEDRPFAITEMGPHTAWQSWGGLKLGSWRLFGTRRRLTDTQAASLLAADLRFWRAQGASLVCIYQIKDGATDDAPGRQGLLYSDLQWKPQADAVRAFLQEAAA